MRTRIVWALVGLGLLAAAVEAANERVLPRDFFARESVTCGATSTGLTATIYAHGTQVAPAPPAAFALITVEADQIRWLATGADADSTGTLANVNDAVELHGIQNIINFRCIRVTTNGTIRVQYAR